MSLDPSVTPVSTASSPAYTYSFSSSPGLLKQAPRRGAPPVGSAENRMPAGVSRGLSALAWRNTGGCRRQGDWVQALQELPSEAVTAKVIAATLLTCGCEESWISSLRHEHRDSSILPTTLPAVAELDQVRASGEHAPGCLAAPDKVGLGPKFTGEGSRFSLNGTENFLMVGIARNHPNNSTMCCYLHYMGKEINPET